MTTEQETGPVDVRAEKPSKVADGEQGAGGSHDACPFGLLFPEASKQTAGAATTAFVPAEVHGLLKGRATNSFPLLKLNIHFSLAKGHISINSKSRAGFLDPNTKTVALVGEYYYG